MEQNNFNCYIVNLKLQTECTSITYDKLNNFTLIGDSKGMISLYDVTKSKAVKIINTKLKNDINHIIHKDNIIYFSQNDNFCYLDIRKEDKLVYNHNNINYCNLGYDINDFDCNNNMILWNDQDNDIYYFYDINKKEIVDSFKLSSAYSQLFINEEVYLFSFEGLMLKYDPKLKIIKTEKNLKNLLSKDEKYGDFVTNPGYFSKVACDGNDIYIGLLNGVIICTKKNLKKKNIKSIHNNMISDLRISNFGEYILTCGKDKKLKVINKSNLSVQYFLEDEAEFIESDVNNNLIYIDKNNFLKIIKLK